MALGGDDVEGGTKTKQPGGKARGGGPGSRGGRGRATKGGTKASKYTKSPPPELHAINLDSTTDEDSACEERGGRCPGNQAPISRFPAVENTADVPTDIPSDCDGFLAASGEPRASPTRRDEGPLSPTQHGSLEAEALTPPPSPQSHHEISGWPGADENSQPLQRPPDDDSDGEDVVPATPPSQVSAAPASMYMRV